MSRYASQLKIRFSAALFLLLLSWTVSAQVQVVDAAGSESNQQSAPAQSGNPPPNANNNSNEIIVTLYNMVEALQREVQTLRGLVEEQSFQIRRMEAEQRDRYLDVDTRLSELNQRISMGNSGTAAGTSLIGSSDVLTPSPLESTAQAALNNNNPGSGRVNAPIATQNTGIPTGPSGNRSAPGDIALNVGPDVAAGQPAEPLSEEELYQQARNFLLNDAAYEQSISVFQQMIEQYPQGRLAPNAYYWQGEALILVERYSQAINVFNQVIESFPDHEKAPDAMLKLGIVYSLMGNERRAEEVWRELLSRFADSGSASLRLAERYLREGYNR